MSMLQTKQLWQKLADEGVDVTIIDFSNPSQLKLDFSNMVTTDLNTKREIEEKEKGIRSAIEQHEQELIQFLEERHLIQSVLRLIPAYSPEQDFHSWVHKELFEDVRRTLELRLNTSG